MSTTGLIRNSNEGDVNFLLQCWVDLILLGTYYLPRIQELMSRKREDCVISDHRAASMHIH